MPDAQTPIVSIVNGQLKTTSRNIAKVFGKPHKNVLRDIEELEIPDDFRGLNFEPTQHLVTAGAVKRKIRCYNVTRDGLTLLAMGYTGKKAMQFKLAYIAAFNAMESELKAQRAVPLPAGMTDADRQTIYDHTLRVIWQMEDNAARIMSNAGVMRASLALVFPDLCVKSRANYLDTGSALVNP